jgi:hypothetical protein
VGKSTLSLQNPATFRYVYIVNQGKLTGDVPIGCLIVHTSLKVMMIGDDTSFSEFRSGL